LNDCFDHRRAGGAKGERIMTGHAMEPAGWVISGFDAMVALAVWCIAAGLYALFRSVAKPDPDPLRPSGPVD